jgi:hypothetical protein
MVGSQSGGDPAHIAGDGDYAIEVVSESRHQDVLEWIVQGRGEEPADHVCMALLALERGDSGTSPVVSVSIRGVQIGHLPPEAADGLIESMQIWGFARATCEAVIEGGWYRSAEDKGDFSVWLDAHPDFTPVADPGAVDLAPALPVAIAVPNANARKTGRDLVFGALATFALMGVIGIVWLVVDQRNEPMFGNRVAVSSSAPN